MAGAHRFAYELLVGPIPEGMTLDHLCHDPRQCLSGAACLHRRCVNPAHLEPVTSKINSRRGGAASATIHGHCANGHPYDEANTALNKYGYRVCLTCRRKQDRDRRARRTHCINSHPLTGRNIFLDKLGRRHCRQCHRDNGRALIERLMNQAASEPRSS